MSTYFLDGHFIVPITLRVIFEVQKPLVFDVTSHGV